MSEPTLFVNTIYVAHTNIHICFTSVDSPIAVKPRIELFWKLESLEITESPSLSEDDKALDHFNKAVKLVYGHYMVTWPMKEENPDLPENYQLAFGRLKSS